VLIQSKMATVGVKTFYGKAKGKKIIFPLGLHISLKTIGGFVT